MMRAFWVSLCLALILKICKDASVVVCEQIPQQGCSRDTGDQLGSCNWYAAQDANETTDYSGAVKEKGGWQGLGPLSKYWLEPISHERSRMLGEIDVSGLQPVSGIVGTQGTQFVLNGEPFYFAGTNAFYIILVDFFTEQEVQHVLQVHASKGAKVIRFFAFSNGDGVSWNNIPTPYALQPVLGQFNEVAFKRIDYVLAEGAKLGLRFILPLVNYEPELGGIQWYVDQVLGPGRPKELFFTDDRVKDAYRKYVRAVITRTNTYNNVKYEDDPAVFAWELGNEPHTSDQYEQNRTLPPGKIVREWADEMSTFIKSLDPKHMVTTGEEGFRADGDTSVPYGNWINGGFKGVDFVGNTNLPNIDFATIHVYPDNWEIPASDIDWIGDNFLRDRARIAHEAGKPVIIEEYGTRPGYISSRDDYFELMHGFFNEYGYAGTLVWSVWHSAPEIESTYNFAYSDDGGRTILQQYRVMNEKVADGNRTPPPVPVEAEGPASSRTQPPVLVEPTGPASSRTQPAVLVEPTGPASCDAECNDVPPDQLYSCQQQKTFGKCEEVWMRGYCRATCGACEPCQAPPTSVNSGPACDPECDDIPPDNYYTCQQQKQFGKCGDPWMQGRCRRTCGTCTPCRASGRRLASTEEQQHAQAPAPIINIVCTDMEPTFSRYSCNQLAQSNGLCDEPWMKAGSTGSSTGFC